MSSVKSSGITCSTSEQARNEFLKSFNKLTYRHRAWDVWKDLIIMFACSISNSVDKVHYDERESLYLRTIRRYNRDERFIFPELTALIILALDFNPEQDFLGSIFMELGLGNDAGGQFFTPYSVCKLMASVTTDDVVYRVMNDGFITINDPTCGAGATLIAGINEAKYKLEKAKINYQNHVLVSAQDIDFTTALMCYIQLSLLGVAAYVKVGNSLTEPMSSSDNMDCYWFTPIYFSDVWSTRRMIQNINSIFNTN